MVYSIYINIYADTCTHTHTHIYIPLFGYIYVYRRAPGEPIMVYFKDDPACEGLENVMQVVYDKRPVPGVFADFVSIKARLNRE